MGLFKKKGAVPIAPPVDNDFAKANIQPQIVQPTPVTQPQPVPTPTPVVETPIQQPIVQEKKVEEPVVQEEHLRTQPNYIEVPTYLSQDKINELIIQNNLMLRQILSMASEDEQ